MAPEINQILSHRLRKLTESGASQEELHETMRLFLSSQREQKLASNEAEGSVAHPLFAKEKPFLSVV